MSQVKVNVLSRVYQLNKTLVGTIGVVSFIALTIAGAYIRIPLFFTPVPITLQTFFVILAGAFLGKKLGLLSQAGYLLVGIFGLPVFTGAVLLGPTSGYLIGFVLAAWVIGRILGSDQEAAFSKIAFAMLAGSAILFTTGALWLSVIMHISLSKAFALGVLPFIPGDIVKIMAAATIYQLAQKPARQLFPNS